MSSQSNYTGADYAAAASVKTDWATADHMRRAMFKALDDWKKFPDDQRTAAKGRELWVDAPLHDPILQKAGTAKIVSEYYRHITDSSRVTDKDMIACMNSISDKDLKGINEGLSKGGIWEQKAMLGAATNFSEAGTKFLKITTLTDSYQGFLKDNKDKLAKIDMPMPQPFTQKEIEHLRDDQWLFNKLDGIDNKLSKISRKLGSPGVAHRMADFDAKTEERIIAVMPELKNLQSGDPQKIKKALENLTSLLSTDDIKLNINAITPPQQVDYIANALERGIRDSRTSGHAGSTEIAMAFVEAVPVAALLKSEAKPEHHADHNTIVRPTVNKAQQATRGATIH